MKVAVAQMNTHTGALQETCKRMLEYAHRAKEENAELIIYPAPALTGLMSLTDATIDSFLEDLFTALQMLAEELPVPAVVPIVVQKDAEFLHEAMLLRGGHVTPLRLAAEIAHLSALTRGSFAETEVETADAEDMGSDLPRFELGDLSLGIAFTYQDLDAWRDADQSADIMLYLGSSGYTLYDKNTAMGLDAENSRFVSDADELNAWLIGVNPVGLYAMHVYIGSSFIMTPGGELAGCGKAFEEDLIFSDIDTTSCDKKYQELSKTYDMTEVEWKALQLGLAEAVIQGGFDGAAVLLDNSLNACVVAALAKSTLSAGQVYVQPSQAHDQLEKDVEYAHVAAVAREKNLLVLGMENKTDIALNPSGLHATNTLYVLGDFYLSEVRDLAKSVLEIDDAASLTPDYRAFDLGGAAVSFSDETHKINFVDYVLAQMLETGKGLSSLLSDVGHPEAVMRIQDEFQKNTFARQGMRPILTFSQCPIVEESFPLFSEWRDTKTSSAPQDTSTLFDGLRSSAEHAFLNSTPERMEMPSPESLQEILEYLREFSGLEGAGVMFGVPKMWRGPFSEN